MAKINYLDFEKPLAALDEKIQGLVDLQKQGSAPDLTKEIASLEKKRTKLLKDIYGSLTPWQMSQIARHPQRPYTLDYVNEIFTDFHELHGDRAYADDSSIVGGFSPF